MCCADVVEISLHHFFLQMFGFGMGHSSGHKCVNFNNMLIVYSVMDLQLSKVLAKAFSIILTTHKSICLK